MVGAKVERCISEVAFIVAEIAAETPDGIVSEIGATSGPWILTSKQTELSGTSFSNTLDVISSGISETTLDCVSGAATALKDLDISYKYNYPLEVI